MPKVGIVMGSDSDMPVMSKAADILEKLGIDYEMRIISAHREPDVFFEYAKTAEEKGFKKRFPVLHCTDAVRYSGSNGCHQWRCKCRPSCS